MCLEIFIFLNQFSQDKYDDLVFSYPLSKGHTQESTFSLLRKKKKKIEC